MQKILKHVASQQKMSGDPLTWVRGLFEILLRYNYLLFLASVDRLLIYGQYYSHCSLELAAAETIHKRYTAIILPSLIITAATVAPLLANAL